MPAPRYELSKPVIAMLPCCLRNGATMAGATHTSKAASMAYSIWQFPQRMSLTHSCLHPPPPAPKYTRTGNLIP